jgi:hypothetical protein
VPNSGAESWCRILAPNPGAPFLPQYPVTYSVGRIKPMDLTVIDLLQIVIVAVTGLGVLLFSVRF